MSESRRDFFRRSGLLATAALGLSPVARAATERPDASGPQPRNIIHLVADGTSMGTLTLGDYFSQLTRKRGLRWLDLYRERGAGSALVNMRSLNSMVTDSSAAASSWGSGSRVVNGVLNQLPDGRNLRTLFELFEGEGWKRGLVTTTEITHATPAGFAINCNSRASAEDIALQYYQRKVDLLLGGGRNYFDPAKRKDKRDLRADFRAAGYTLLDKAADLDRAPIERPWLGTFDRSHLPYTIDWAADSAIRTKVPSLAHMTRFALKKLGREQRFILQIEGGRIDHAAHGCDIATAVREVVAFDEAIEVAVDFQAREPETLLIVTVDHGTGNPGLNGTGTAYKESPKLFAHTLGAMRSFESLEAEFKKATTVAQLQKVVLAASGYAVPDAKAALLLAFIEKKNPPVYDTMNGLAAQLGQLVANRYGVGWSSGSHTADFVPLVALGPGADRFSGFLQNTDVFHHYVALAGIDFRNPEAPLQAETGPSADEAEAIARTA
jgi:alkaline phosphatase